MRHGKTHYTGEPRDLTSEGIAQVVQVARSDVLEWMRVNAIDPRKLRIQSSPAPRAHYTAYCVAEVIHNGHGIVPTLLPAPGLGPVVRRDEERAKKVYADLGAGNRYVSYENEPDFQNSDIFETPIEVRTRWYEYLTQYIHGYFPCPAIFVSHYEVLCNITNDLFGITATKETELQHAEPIQLFIEVLDAQAGLVTISGTFRGGLRANAVFSLLDGSIDRRA